MSKRLTARWKGQSASVISYANKAGRRLSKKFNRLIFRNKKSQVAVTAVARELAGFILGMMVGQTVQEKRNDIDSTLELWRWVEKHLR